MSSKIECPRCNWFVDVIPGPPNDRCPNCDFVIATCCEGSDRMYDAEEQSKGTSMENSIVRIAIVCHEANRSYCEQIGDNSQSSWGNAPEWQRESAINGVIFHRNNPDADDAASHENWLKEKYADGWTFGREKNVELKTHPCMMPFADLPKEQQYKDSLFRAIVHALKDK